MQKSLTSSFRRNIAAKRERCQSSVSGDAEKEMVDRNKKFVDVGVQTEIQSEHCQNCVNSQFFDKSGQPKVGIVLPPNYTIVFLDGANYSIVKSDTKEKINFIISPPDPNVTEESSHPNDSQDNIVTSTSDAVVKPRQNIYKTCRRSSSFLEPGLRPTAEEGKIQLRTTKDNVPRHHSFHLTMPHFMKGHNHSVLKSSQNPITKDLQKLVDLSLLLPASQSIIKDVDISYLEDEIQFLTEIMLCLKSQSMNSRIPFDDLSQYLCTVFGISAEGYANIQKQMEDRTVSTFTLRIEKISAQKLKPRYSKGLADTYAVVRLASSPNVNHTTNVIVDTLNPEWSEHVCFDIAKATKPEDLVVEVWDKILDENVKERMHKAIDVKGASTLKKMKNAVQATVGSNSEDRLIGSVTLPLNLCYERTDWLELHKKDKSKKRGQIQITYVKCYKSQPKTVALEFQKLSHSLILREMKERNFENFTFKGDFSDNAREILQLHARNGGLTAEEIAFLHWIVSVDIHLNHRLSFVWFLELLKPIFDYVTPEKPSMVAQFWSSTVKLLPSMFCTIRDVRKLYHKNQSENWATVLNLLENILKIGPPKDIILFPEELYTSWIDVKVPLTWDVVLKESIESGTKSYFEEITVDVELSDFDTEENIQNSILTVQLLQTDVQKAAEFFDRAFQKILNFQYSKYVYLVYDELLKQCLETPIRKACKSLKSINYDDLEPNKTDNEHELNKKTFLFDLFLNLSQFLKLGQYITLEATLKLNNFQLWFFDCVIHWLHISISKARAQIPKAILLDKLLPIDETSQHSTSAVDTLEIIGQQKVLWNQLNWPNAEEAFSFMQRIAKDICNCVDLYAEKLSEKVERIIRPTGFIVTQEWCTSTNNIQYICDNLLTLVDNFGFDRTINQLGPDYDASTLKAVIENTRETMLESNQRSLTQMGDELVETIGSQLLELAKDSKFEHDALDILMSFLENSLQLLNTGLIEKNFDFLLENLLSKIVQTVDRIVRNGITEVRPVPYFNNIQKALECLLQSFKSASNLTQSLNTSIESILSLLKKHGASTCQLVCAYYKERLKEQAQMTNASIGTLTVACHFKGLDLNITIMNAKDLPPMNLDGKTSNAYIKVMMLPEDMFLDLKKMKTKPKKKTLFPMFDETFVVPLTVEQKTSKDIIIHFEVINRDAFGRTTQKNHIGDGFLSIDQVEEWQSDVAIIKQHSMKLSRASSFDYECIQLMEKRQSVDKEAKEFLKELKSKSCRIVKHQ